MTKKLLILCMSALMVLSLASCSTGDSNVDVAKLTSDCIELVGINSWQTAAAAYIMNKDFSELLIKKPESDGTVHDMAESVLFDALVSNQPSSAEIARIKQYIEEKPADLSTVEMALCAYALNASGTEYDHKNAAKELESRQKTDGGFARANDYAASEPTPSAYAIDLVKFWRDAVSDKCFDGALVYFYNTMTDQNVWKDESGDPSCSVSSVVLCGFIHAGIRYDGDDSRAIAKSIRVLYSINDTKGNILGFKQYTKSDTMSQEACGDALLALASSQVGDLWSVIEARK